MTENEQRAAGAPPIRRDDVFLAVGDERIGFKVADRPDAGIFFGLGIRKSGSTMLNRLLGFLAQRNGINIVDVPGAFFQHGLTVADWEMRDLTSLLRPGNLFAGFRNYPTRLAETEAYAAAPKVFMFRDPRDALVSQYFSDAYSHSLPSGTGAAGDKGRAAFSEKRAQALDTTLDEWVLQKMGGMRKTLLRYADALDDPTCLILRYEDYVFQKRRLAHKIMAHFGWQVPPGPLEKFIAGIDIVPDSEDNTRFVRRVIPGDHNAKLRPETVRRLTNQLSEVLRLYDYV